jgi:hypothetical protein
MFSGLVVAASCSVDPVGDPSSDLSHAPAAPSANHPGVDAVASDVTSEPVSDAEPPQDVSVEAAGDATADGAADAGCGAASCVGRSLKTWSLSSEGCCYVLHSCPGGCVVGSQGASCAELTPACALGSPPSAGTPCPFLADGLCFASFADACACYGCAEGTCKTKGPRLKLPGAPGMCKPAPPDAASDAASDAPASDAGSAADAGTKLIVSGCTS